MKKLSVITINYNDAKGLERTILSVIKQTFKDFEYIVIDGDSTDGSKEILKKYRDQLDIAISEPDKGIYNAMNKGASHATGEYLLFLNSGDNFYASDVLAKLFLLNPTDDIVSSRVINYTDKYRNLKIPPTNVSLFTFTGGSLPHPSSLIKNDLFRRIGGYSEAYRIISDWCFFVDAILKYNATYATTDITMIEFNGYGISTNHGAKENKLREDYLNLQFGRIMIDYLPTKDEAISNVAFWISQQSGYKKAIISLPFKVVNRLLGLRNRLSRRMGIVKACDN